MKKLTALFTALLMTLLVGCGEGGKAAKLVAVEEDAKSFNYSVVRPKGCSEDIEAAAKEIRSKLRKTYGVSVTVRKRIMTVIMKYLSAIPAERSPRRLSNALRKTAKTANLIL